MDPFTTFLSQWLVGNALTYGTMVAGRKLAPKLRAFEEDPASHGCPSEFIKDGKLLPDQQGLIRVLGTTNPSMIRRTYAKLWGKTKRSIAVVGPSGVGKTRVALHLAGLGHKPVTMSSKPEQKSLVALKSTPVLVPPGSSIHGDTSWIYEQIKKREPPKVICVVVAGGFHATADPAFYNSLLRPGYGDKPVAKDLEGFLSHNLKEELIYLDKLLEATKDKIKRRIPWIITIANKRDLWQAWDDADDTLDRYRGSTSPYACRVKKLQKAWSMAGNAVDHEVLPVYLEGNGFSPDPNVPQVAMTSLMMQADAMVMRALVFYRFTEGSGIHD